MCYLQFFWRTSSLQLLCRRLRLLVWVSEKTPNFDVLADVPAVMNAPGVEVLCDDSKLTVVVVKRSFRHRLSRGELLLGEGCYSNADLGNKFVISYDLNKCGTTHVMRNGLNIFTNSLHLNLKEPFASWWQTPRAVHISCIPTRSYDYSGITRTLRGASDHISIRIMTPSWSKAESNVYERGQVVNLQVSGKIRPDQQIFIQSCFVSASPGPRTRPRHAVIFNKGCATWVGSSHPIVQFEASNGPDEVNFILNTSRLISEFYVHCSVLLSGQGLTCGSKSCNYNVIKSRWEDLNSDVEVCDCCSSRCKDSSVRNFPDVKAIVSVGPLVIVDVDGDVTSSHPASKPEGTISDAGLADVPSDVIVSGTSVSRSRFPTPSRGVVMVRQDPGARQILWQPGQHGTENFAASRAEKKSTVQHSDGMSGDVTKERPPTTQRTSPLKLLNQETKSQSGSSKPMNLLSVVSQWLIHPQPDITFIAEEFETNDGFRKPDGVDTEAMQDNNFLPGEVNINFLIMAEEMDPSQADHVTTEEDNQRKKRFSYRAELDPHDSRHVREKQPETPVDEDVMPECAKDKEPIIRSKIQFTKAMDGSMKLSYEEDVIQQQGGKSVVSHFGRNGMKRRRDPELKGLHSTFLHLLRRMDRAE